MKRILTLILILALALSVMASCSKIPGLDKIKLPWDKNDTTNEGTGDNTGDNNTGDNTGDNNTGDNTPVVDEDLKAAYDFIKMSYKDKKETNASFEIMKSAPIGDKEFPITWTVDNTQIKITESENGDYYVVNIPERQVGDPAFTYTLSFSIENAAGEKREGSFTITVPECRVNTFAQYAAAADGTALTVEGIITGFNSKADGDKDNSIYMQDLNNEGGYYIYALEKDPTETLAIGMTIQVKGEKATYSGTYEIKNATVTVLDETIKPVTPVDFTEIYTNAGALDAPELAGKQGMLVTIKGVTVGGKLESKGYYYFELAGKQTYVRISSSNNCTSKANGEEDALIAAHAAHYYDKADVTGLITVYNGLMYLSPVSADCFTNFTVLEKDDNFKVDVAYNNTKVSTIIQQNGSVTLPVVGEQFDGAVSIAWALVSGDAVLDGNTITYTVAADGAAKTVVLKATFTLNDVTKEKEYTVTVKGIDTITLEQVDNITANMAGSTYTEEVFYIVGTIDSIVEGGEAYGNMYIVADGYTLYIYGLYDANGKKYGDIEGDKPKVGDTIKVLSTVGKYGNDSQLKNATIVEWNHNYDDGKVVPPNCQAQGYTEYTCKCGYIHKDNFTAQGNCYYGDDDVCDACGVKNHEHALVAGTVVAPTCIAEGYTVYTCLDADCAYTENKDATGKVDHVDADGDEVCDTEGCDAEVIKLVTIPDAIAAADGTKVVVKGTVCTVNGAWNSQYGNMNVTITDADGNTLYIYRVKTQVALGDIITVTGEMGTYDGRQVINGTAVIDGHDSSYDYTEMTIAEALEAADGTNVIISGIVVEIGTAYSADYNNISVYITDGVNTIYLYRLSGNVEVNDIITVKGSMATYKGRQVTGGTFVKDGVHTCEFSDATCTEDAKCAGCGATGDKATGHDYEENTWFHPELVPATCVAPGVAVFECINCDYYYTEASAIDLEGGHNFFDDACIREDLVQVNCLTQTNGIIKITCCNEGCNATYEVEIDYNDYHNWEVETEIYATCTEDGAYKAVCTICEAVDEYSIPAGGHYNWLPCGETGECVECGEVFTKDHDGQAPTCTEPGYCYSCWSEYGEPTGHNYEAGVCTNCGELDPASHTCEFVAGEVVEPTCTEGGYTVYSCVCGKSENRDETNPLNHVGTETTTTTKPSTCTVLGATVVTCECGAEISSTPLTELLPHVDENGDFKCDYNCNTVIEPADGTVLTIAQAQALGALYVNETGGKYTTGWYYVTGTITEFTGNSWQTYGGCIITDGTDSFAIYGLRDSEGKILYGNLEIKPYVGDTITVYGQIGAYKSSIQIEKGSVKELVVGHEHDNDGPDCYDAAKCKLCGLISGVALGHSFGDDGVCTACGHNPNSGEPAWTLVTDVSTLKAGDQIVIAAKDYAMALGETQNGNNRASAAITKTGNTITIDDTVEIITLGGAEGAWTFSTDDGYLYAASTSKNYLKSQATVSDNGKWTIAVSADGVATIKSVGNTVKGWMRFNSTNSPQLFSCYGSGQADICIYVLTTPEA